MITYSTRADTMFNSTGSFLVAVRPFLGISIFITAAQAHGQSVPADLIDMSIDDLLSADIRGDDGSFKTPARPWTFAYAYHNSKFNDYLDGTTNVSNDELLFSPGEEARTEKNFPVVPTDIEQEIHTISVKYALTNKVSFSASVPYIRQSTDHVSIIPGFDAFNISSSGLGDIAVVAHYRFNESISGHWQAGLGMSFPTGSIDETGDTPRAPGNQQLPYTMQHGSGTYDIPAYIAYRATGYNFEWGAGLSGKLRLGENDRDYRLGNRLSAISWIRFTTLGLVQPLVKLHYRYWTDIHGEDSSLTMPGPYPYPAPVVNPALFGGDLLSLALGLRVPILGPHRYVDLEFSKPIYQSLNGPQSSEDYRFAIAFSLEF